MKVPLPAGRRVTYFAFRAAERFGQPPAWFYSLSRDEQGDIYAYELIREEEEAEDLKLLASPRM